MTNITESAKTETGKKPQYNGPRRVFTGLVVRTLVQDVQVTMQIDGKNKSISLQEVVDLALKKHPYAISHKMNCDSKTQEVALGTAVVKRNDEDYGGYSSNDLSMTRMAPEMVAGNHRKTAPTDMNGDPKSQSEIYRSFVQFT